MNKDSRNKTAGKIKENHPLKSGWPLGNSNPLNLLPSIRCGKSAGPARFGKSPAARI